MKTLAGEYYRQLATNIAAIRVTDRAGRVLDLSQGVAAACGLIHERSLAGGKVFFIGNGGSAAISSHMAVDFFKRGGIPSLSFNDPAMLTCMGNDYGYAHVFEKPLEGFAREGDVLIAISSSGRSENILLGAAAVRAAGGIIVTLSGFYPDNPLFSLGDVNFHVPSGSYGQVEVIHHSVCHCMLDTLVAYREGKDV